MNATIEQGSIQKAPDKDFINVEEVFRKKSKGLYRLIPKALIRYLERIVHEKDINKALRNHHDKMGVDFLKAALFEELGVQIKIQNPENIPYQGRYILVSNHPLGGMDGMAIMYIVGQKRSDFKFISNDILLELINIRDLFIPVNKHGRNSLDAVKALEEYFAGDGLVLLFPAGLVSRKQKGGIADLEWKKTFVSKALKHHRDIVPVYVEGRNSNFFYNLARWRKRLRIKANIEMLFLADEMFKQKGQTITLHFGKPIPYTTFTNDKTHLEWAQEVKKMVYNLHKS